MIDQVKATLELQTLVIPLGEEPAAGNQREVTEVVKKILDMNEIPYNEVMLDEIMGEE